jgi:probable phosphoglycerate mutase
MKSNTVQLILVRHGETLENAGRTVQGQIPGTLSQKGLQQAKEAGSLLSSHCINAIYSSDLARAWETAQIIAGSFPGTMVVPEPKLREQDLGRYQGGPIIKLLRRLKEEGRDITEFDPEEGEPAAVFCDRVKELVNLLAARHTGETVLLVTHHGFIRMFMKTIEGLKGMEQMDIPVRNGAVVFITFDKSEVTELWRADSFR